MTPCWRRRCQQSWRLSHHSHVPLQHPRHHPSSPPLPDLQQQLSSSSFSFLKEPVQVLRSLPRFSSCSDGSKLRSGWLDTGRRKSDARIEFERHVIEIGQRNQSSKEDSLRYSYLQAHPLRSVNVSRARVGRHLRRLVRCPIANSQYQSIAGLWTVTSHLSRGICQGVSGLHQGMVGQALGFEPQQVRGRRTDP